MWRPVDGLWTSSAFVELLEVNQVGGTEGAVDEAGRDEVDGGGWGVKERARFGKPSEKRSDQKEGTTCVVDSEDGSFATSDEIRTGDVGAEDVVLSQESGLIEGSDSLRISERLSMLETSAGVANPSSW